RADQRFHLELALLKLVHAQRLIPLEQLLSASGEVAPGSKPSQMPAARSARQSLPSAGAESQTSAPVTSGSRRESPSPFELDRARRRGETEMSSSGGAATALQAVPIAAVATIEDLSSDPNADLLSRIQRSVLEALENAGHRMLASTLDSGHWNLQQSELLIQAPAAPSLLEMAVTADARRVITT